jgi:NTP-dependent ternary system trypsin peptidase co-occuring protein
MGQIELSEAIANLRAELTTALEHGADEALRFDVGQIELELELELTVSGGAKAEAKWLVVSFGGEAKAERASSHRIKLILTPKHRGADLEIASTKPVKR